MVGVIRFGLIGCGAVSGAYLHVLQKSPHARVAAVADADAVRAADAARRYGVAAAYGDWAEMIDRERLDAVVIATPHFAHHEQALYCAQQGLDILCEKPLATSMAHVQEMVAACARVRFSVMLQRRFYPNTRALARVVAAGALGALDEVSLRFSCHKSPQFYATWRGKRISGGGVLLSQALHRIDQLASVFGDPQAVEGLVRTTRPDIEVEDYARGSIFFANGVEARIEADNTSGNPATLSIITVQGERGRVVLSDDRCQEWDAPGFAVPDEADITAIPAEHRPEYYGPCHELVITDFVEAMVQDRPPAIRGEDALPSMRIIFGFYEAARRGVRLNV